MQVMPEAPTTIRQNLADNMRRLREEQDWSQEDLAKATNIHHNQISAMERCKHSVGIDIIERIAQAFGVTAGELLDLQAPPKEPPPPVDDTKAE